MITMSPSMPPAMPSDASLLGAMQLLSALGSPANTAATLDTLAEHKRAIDAAIAANTAAVQEATAAQAALSNLEARDADLTARELRSPRRAPPLMLRRPPSRSASAGWYRGLPNSTSARLRSQRRNRHWPIALRGIARRLRPNR